MRRWPLVNSSSQGRNRRWRWIWADEALPDHAPALSGALALGCSQLVALASGGSVGIKMILKSSHIIITFGVGFGASSITEGAPIVLLILMTLLAAAALVWMRFDLDLTLKLPNIQLSRSLTQVESSTPPSTHGGFVLGFGHQVRR